MIAAPALTILASPAGPDAAMALKIWVTAKPQAHQESVKKISAGEYLVSVLAPARDGKANRAVVELLARHFSVPKTAVKILHGHSGRRKLVAIG